MNEYEENYSTLDDAYEKITTDGFCVIKNVLNENEIKNAQNGLWETLNYLTKNLDKPIKYEDKESWKTYYELRTNRNMLMQHWQIGQSQFFWDIRQNPKVVNIFSKLWNVKNEDLLTSFDGMSFHVPPEETGIGFYEGNDWFHTDQAPNNKEFSCIQGFVTLYDINKGDATLRVIKNSCNYHNTIFDINNVDSDNNWHQYQDDELEYLYNNNCKPVRVLAKAGDFVLWDSRTAHYGIEPLKERNKANFRSVLYICMTPRKLISEKSLKSKKKGFLKMRMTTHWPHRAKLFRKYPMEFNDIEKIPELPNPKLTELGEKLAGF